MGEFSVSLNFHEDNLPPHKGPVMRSFAVGPVISFNNLLIKMSSCWWFKTTWRSLRHCDDVYWLYFNGCIDCVMCIKRDGSRGYSIYKIIQSEECTPGSLYLIDLPTRKSQHPQHSYDINPRGCHNRSSVKKKQITWGQGRKRATRNVIIC